MSRSSQTSARSAPALRWPLAQAWRVWALLALMLAFQGLGQSHRVLHSAGFARALVPLASLAPASAVSDAQAARMTSGEGWGHTRGELICLLLDQLSHEHAPLALPSVALQDTAFARPNAAPVASLHLAAYWKRAARGPPSMA